MEPIFINSIINMLQGRSIFLIGMMGAGKSATGPKLAENLKYKFIDLDILIEKVAKKSIKDIFLKEGESYFRDLETKCLQEIIKVPSMVISTGGGIITKTQNWGILHQGIVVWIDINKNVALERLNGEIINRPLFKNHDIEKTYTDLFHARKNLYSQADLHIQISNENVEEVKNKILLKLYKDIKG